MKKLLAVLLAGLMLCGFGISAAAQTPEDLLAQTMADLADDYTIAGRLSFRETRKDYVDVVHSGGAYAFLREDGVRDIHFQDKAVRVYPERGAWHTLTLSYSCAYLPLLAPKEIASITAQEWYDSLEASFDGYSYWYKDDILWSIENETLDMLISTFSMEATPDIFSLEGMREVPEFMKWAWEPQEAFAINLDEHPMFNTVFGRMLSALITVLVVVFMPLLYLVILVLRVLFYFDLYKA